MWIPLLLMTLAFGQEPTEAAPEPFVCCDSQPVTDVVRRAMAVHDVLAEPGNDAIGAQLYGLRGAVIKLKKAASSDDERAVVARLREAIEELKDKPRSKVQAELGRLMQPVVYLALNHIGGDLEVAEAYCDSRSPWLQSPSEPLRSPFADGCAAWRR